MRIVCLIRGLCRSVKYFAPCTGHNLTENGRCETCGAHRKVWRALDGKLHIE